MAWCTILIARFSLLSPPMQTFLMLLILESETGAGKAAFAIQGRRTTCRSLTPAARRRHGFLAACVCVDMDRGKYLTRPANYIQRARRKSFVRLCARVIKSWPAKSKQ
jgi:hypothetical protein